MEALIEKISSYNLFNFLLPGVLFVAFINKYTRHKIKIDNLFITAFVCYFIGLVISRLGSLFIDPFLEWVSFIKRCNYSDYVLASKKDLTIEKLSEMNNMYRNILTLGVLLLFLKVFEILENKYPRQIKWSPYIFVLILLIIFLFSYRKQIGYINKRVMLYKTEKTSQ